MLRVAFSVALTEFERVFDVDYVILMLTIALRVERVVFCFFFFPGLYEQDVFWEGL